MSDFRTPRRSAQALSMNECLSILDRRTYGVLGTHGTDGYPYAVPMSYVRTGDRIYLHCSHEGHRAEALCADSRVSFCVVDRDTPCEERFTTLYRSVIVFGKVRVISQGDIHAMAMGALMDRFSPGQGKAARHREMEGCGAAVLELTMEHVTGKQARELSVRQDGAEPDEGFTYRYPRPAVTADCVVISTLRPESVLLIRRASEPFCGCWALPGGFMEMGESADECAARELAEETGLTTSTLRQIGAYSAVGRDPRGRTLSIAYLATLSSEAGVTGADDALQAAWFPLNDLPELAFDHARILADAVEMLRSGR